MEGEVIKDLKREQKSIMEKVDKLTESVNDIKVDIAKLPELLSAKFDARYAKKEIEDEVKALKTINDCIKEEGNKRTFSWLYFLVTLIVGSVVGGVITLLFNTLK